MPAALALGKAIVALPPFHRAHNGKKPLRNFRVVAELDAPIAHLLPVAQGQPRASAPGRAPLRAGAYVSARGIGKKLRVSTGFYGYLLSRSWRMPDILKVESTLLGSVLVALGRELGCLRSTL
ncbi:hypothetical protein [Sphingomonas sp. LaA6.9]|uniref:hypothetical protein n=1 Tax=Sphingomonas sp. LaA6.9 TaxID=2919914 RepID=UPI001F501FB0|nr:hypothetical protein [Sphingomonas sp. LaA6.9]MCJ8157575.1 hypothetical protein [Sphingomonas sp. LaA6.9]